jgi:hypothetical protein
VGFGRPDARDGVNRHGHRVSHGTVVVAFDVGEDVGLAAAGVGLRDTGNLSQCRTTSWFLPGSTETST